jgi:hypothetical protein
MDLEKIFFPYNLYIYRYISIDCRGKVFFHILIIEGALKASLYRNRDILPKSAPFYKKGVLACKRPFFKKWVFSCHKAPSFFKRGRFVLNAPF